MRMSYKLFSNRLQHLPIALTGLALGLGGLGNCLALFFNNINDSQYDAKWITYITMSLVILILLIMMFKNILHPKVLQWEINEPMMVSLLPTFSMSLMLVSGFIASFDTNKYSPNQIIGSILMIISLLIQTILIYFFVLSLYRNHIQNKNNPMYGSYFVPTVGLITSCTIANNFTLLPNKLFQAIWFISFILYVLTFPVITWNILFKSKPNITKFPVVAVWFAPTNLTPAGFIKVFLWENTSYSTTFLNIIFIFTTICGFAFSIIFYIYVVKIFVSCKFNPIFCSITFPSAIGATSMLLCAGYYKKNFLKYQIEFFKNATDFFGYVGLLFLIMSFLLILYILTRMSIVCYKLLFTSSFDTFKHDCYK